jgi:hypothetical protein
MFLKAKELKSMEEVLRKVRGAISTKWGLAFFVYNGSSFLNCQ